MSALEDTFEMQLKALKLHGYEREYKFHPTRRWRFDFAFVNRKFAIEIHGAIYANGRHSRGAGIEGDMEKINTAQEMGWDVYCVSGPMIKNGNAVQLVERILKMQGTRE